MSKPTASRLITEPLGGSALSVAVQTRGLPAGLQPWFPSSPRDWKEHTALVRGGAATSWYDTLGPAFGASGAAAKRIERSANGQGIVVTTGQQAGLFGGPLYTLAKALTALGLADSLEQELGIPVAPVFWAATDDADFLEASVAHVADADGLRELTLAARPAAGTPMSAAQLGDTAALVDALRKACGSAAHAGFFRLASESFVRGRTVGDAYVSFLRGLLEPLGIAVMDSCHPAYRDAARPMLTEALERAPEIARATSARAGAIQALGFDPQVEDDRGLSLVFAIESGVKRRLSLDEASAFTSHSSAELSPNVLLRPVVERHLLPTVSYVAGPGELAYFAQASAVASAMEREPAVGVPRWSCTVIEPFAERALERLGVAYDEVKDIHALERRLAMAALPADVASAWKRLQQQVSDSVRGLASAVHASSLLPPAVMEGLERSLGHRLGRAERRLIAAVKRRDDRVRHDLRVVSDALFPTGNRQERVLNYVPMLARGGAALMDEMRRAARAHAETLLGVERAERLAVR